MPRLFARVFLFGVFVCGREFSPFGRMPDFCICEKTLAFVFFVQPALDSCLFLALLAGFGCFFFFVVALAERNIVCYRKKIKTLLRRLSIPLYGKVPKCNGGMGGNFYGNCSFPDAHFRILVYRLRRARLSGGRSVVFFFYLILSL